MHISRELLVLLLKDYSGTERFTVVAVIGVGTLGVLGWMDRDSSGFPVCLLRSK